MTPDELRAAFEAWAREQEGPLSLRRSSDRFEIWLVGIYVNEATKLAWRAFHHAYDLGLSAGLERAARICERRAVQRFGDHGITEPDTNASYYQGSARDVYNAMDEEDEACAAAIRKETKK